MIHVSGIIRTLNAYLVSFPYSPPPHPPHPPHPPSSPAVIAGLNTEILGAWAGVCQSLSNTVLMRWNKEMFLSRK